MRRKTKIVNLGHIKIGYKYPIYVQSMLKNYLENFENVKKEVEKLLSVGCEIIRFAVPDRDSIKYIKPLKSFIYSISKEKNYFLPALVADIHFDYKLALLAMEEGVEGIRINPGNIKRDYLKDIINVANSKNICIRIGVNTGSLPKKIQSRYSTLEIVYYILDLIKEIEDLGFTNLKVSVKDSDVINTIKINKLLAQKIDYPIHLGVTEAGTFLSGTVKSSIGLGALLLEGIGDTIRVSLTDESYKEVIVGFEILKALKLREGINIISCPTCGRCKVNVKKIAKILEKNFSYVRKNVNVAVMGCSVNGPGEAKHADIGIAGAEKYFLFFKKGKVVGKGNFEEALNWISAQLKTLT